MFDCLLFWVVLYLGLIGNSMGCAVSLFLLLLLI